MTLKKCKLGDLVEVTRGMSLPGEYYAEEGELIRLTLGNFNLNGSGFKENTSKKDIYYVGPVKDEFILKKGDIITPLTEQSLGLLGTTARIPESRKYIQSQDVALVTCKEGKIDPDFCYYLISSQLVRHQLSIAAQQTKIRHTSPEKIISCTVWVPELAEQKRIGQLLTDIDNKIQLNTAINRNLEAFAKQLYDYWFVQFDFPNENGKPYKASGGKMVWNEQLKRKIPKDWKVSNICSLLTMYMERCDYVPDGLVYTPIEVLPRKSMSFYEVAPLEEAVSGLCRYYKGDVLLSNRRIYFHKVCIAPFDGVTRDTVITLRSNDDKYYCYAFQTINSDHFISWATKHSYGSEQPVFSWNEARNYLVAIPPTQIAEKFESIVRFSIDKVCISQLETQNLIKQRDELLPLLMNGQVAINSDLSHY